MICLICRQAETAAGLTSVEFARGETRLIVRSVPARICPRCGEAYVHEDVVVGLLRDAEKISEVGSKEDTIEYNQANS